MARAQTARPDVAAAADLMQELLNATRKDRTPTSLSVGIRNVSSETIGIPAVLGGAELLLYPKAAEHDDPNTVAIITYAQWQVLRKHAIVGKGMLIRDDSILGEIDTKGPADKPEDLHPDHLKNLVLNPKHWIESREEPELRQAVSAMTSESSLRRLWAAVDGKVGELEKDVPLAERKSKFSPGIKKAINELPMRYRLVEQLIEDRLDELMPLQRDIPDTIRI